MLHSTKQKKSSVSDENQPPPQMDQVVVSKSIQAHAFNQTNYKTQFGLDTNGDRANYQMGKLM